MRRRFTPRREWKTGCVSLRAHPQLELLECRLAPAIITVTTTADDITPNDGSVSLREAITAINAGNDLGDPDITAQNPGTFGANDRIGFNIPGTSPFQVNVGSNASAANLPLPAITRPVTIDGTTQPGPATLIIINGQSAGAGANGFDIRLGAQPMAVGVTIKGFVINQFSANGVLIEADNVSGTGATASTIIDNYIGTNAANTAAMGNKLNGILIDATNSNNLGLAASDNVISNNVISGNSNDGVLIQAHNGVAAGNIVTANAIGTDFTTTVAIPNNGDGVGIDGASGNIIGVASGGTARNIISDNQGDGIHVVGTLTNPATGNVVANNFVGVDVTGGKAQGNQSFGIEVSGGNSNSIGGNVVGANSDGIELDNGAQSNIVQGNFIGVGLNGSAQVGNKLHGIALRSDDSLTPPLGPGQTNEPGVRNNLIGGAGAGDGNTIAFNAVSGVAVFGNPVSLSGQANTGNTIEGNSIFQNGRSDPSLLAGIDLSNQSPYPKDDGPTPNGSRGHGAANDPNNFQNFPLLSSITPTATGSVIQGTLDQAVSANTRFRIDFYASNPDPQNGVVEGQFFLGSGAATTNASGHASFTITVPARVALNQLITATATDPAGNTSEFSAGIAAPSANQFYVAKVYHDLLGREVDPGGLAFWTAQLNSGFPRSQMVLSIETDSHHEYYSTLVRSFYSFYLHRTEGSGDQTGATNFVNFMAGGGPIEQIRATFTSSPEYFQTRGGNAAKGFVNALYLDAFGTPNRVASDPGAANFATSISNGTMTTSQVSLIVFTSDEFRFDLVQSFYKQFLNRSGSANEVNPWVAQLKQGTTDQTVIALILGSPEAFTLASTFTPAAPALRAPSSINPDLYGPIFSDVPLNGRPNLNDLYVFRAPGDTALTPNFGSTDLIATVSPFAGVLTPLSFDSRLTLDFNVVNTTGHLTPDFTFQATFSPPVPAGQTFDQVVTLRLIQGNTTTTIAQYTYVGSQTVPPLAFANNITFPGDAIATGKFMAGVFDDPSFFDAQGYAQFARTPSNPATPFPRPQAANPAAPLPTDAKNFYHNANILALVLEVPTVKLTTANPPLLGVWADSKVNGTQVQRLGRPLLDALLIPPVPRSDLSRGDRRTAFNQGSPSTDVANFRADMIAVLTSPNFIYQRSPADATALVDAAFGATIVGPSSGLSPDMLTVDLSKIYTDATNGFPNGRRFRDDVVDILFNVLTNGKVTTDNVSDDNGTTITDGLGGIGATTFFPYIGKPNTPAGGGNP